MANLKKVVEKRKSQRLGLNLLVKSPTLGKRGITAVVYCEDIGGRGLRVRLKEKLVKDEKLEIFLYPQDNAKPIRTLSKVIWCRQNKKNDFSVGLEFLNIKEKEHFIDFICTKMLELSCEAK